MNVTGFSDDDNDTFVGNRSVDQYDDHYYNYTSEEPSLDWTTVRAVCRNIFYVVWALGIPGNILSAIVWLRRHVASENPSAIYLAALAINDLVFLLSTVLCKLKCNELCWVCLDTWYCCLLASSVWSTIYLETLLVLGFSVVRLIAIRRPLQVGCITRFRLTGNSAVVERSRGDQYRLNLLLAHLHIYM